MVEGLYRFQHPTFISWRQFLKGKQCFWEDAREFEEPCTWRADYRQITELILCKRVAKPNFYGGNPITDCLAGQCRVATLTLNRPIYVSFSVLELSKLHMYDFHYNHMCVKYPHANHFRLLFMDMDSLANAVQTDNIYRDMVDVAASRHDFSEYPLDHPLYDRSNCKALGFCKDELNSMPLPFYVQLKWIRMYLNTLDL